MMELSTIIDHPDKAYDRIRALEKENERLRADIGKRDVLIRDMYDWGDFMNLPSLDMGKRIRELGIEVCT